MLTKEEVFKKLEENRERIKKYGVKRIGLFGSFVRGEAKEESDIDFIAEFYEDRKNYENFINLVYFLEELCERKVELITLESISPHIKSYIEKEIAYIKL